MTVVSSRSDKERHADCQQKYRSAPRKDVTLAMPCPRRYATPDGGRGRSRGRRVQRSSNEIVANATAITQSFQRRASRSTGSSRKVPASPVPQRRPTQKDAVSEGIRLGMRQTCPNCRSRTALNSHLRAQCFAGASRCRMSLRESSRWQQIYRVSMSSMPVRRRDQQKRTRDLGGERCHGSSDRRARGVGITAKHTAGGGG